MIEPWDSPSQVSERLQAGRLRRAAIYRVKRAKAARARRKLLALYGPPTEAALIAALPPPKRCEPCGGLGTRYNVEHDIVTMTKSACRDCGGAGTITVPWR